MRCGFTFIFVVGSLSCLCECWILTVTVCLIARFKLHVQYDRLDSPVIQV